MALYDDSITDLMDLKIFVHTDDDIWLAWRIKWDVTDWGRTIESVLEAYNKFVKTCYDEFVKPTMRKADILVPWGVSNVIAIDLVVNAVDVQMKAIQFGPERL